MTRAKVSPARDGPRSAQWSPRTTSAPSWVSRWECPGCRGFRSPRRVHRPPMAGIAGKVEEGSQSIVLAGGYEDDEDNGDTFLYTGAGGRDLRELQSRVSSRH